MKEFFQDFKDEFILNYVDGNMWKWLVDGLKNTLIITFFALIIGVVIGIIVASIRSTFDKNREVYKRQHLQKKTYKRCFAKDNKIKYKR